MRLFDEEKLKYSNLYSVKFFINRSVFSTRSPIADKINCSMDRKLHLTVWVGSLTCMNNPRFRSSFVTRIVLTNTVYAFVVAVFSTRFSLRTIRKEEKKKYEKAMHTKVRGYCARVAKRTENNQ